MERAEGFRDAINSILDRQPNQFGPYLTTSVGSRVWKIGYESQGGPGSFGQGRRFDGIPSYREGNELALNMWNGMSWHERAAMLSHREVFKETTERNYRAWQIFTGDR